MRVYMEVDAMNPRTGQDDYAYVTVEIDDRLIADATDPIAFAADQLRGHIQALLETQGATRG